MLRRCRRQWRNEALIAASAGFISIGTGGFTTPASAQELDEQAPGFGIEEPVSTFYTIDSEPERARMSLHGTTRLQGYAPLTIPGDLYGSFQIEAELPGYERQRGLVRFPGAAGPIEVEPALSGARALLPALAWPGMGEIRRRGGDAVRGAGWLAAGVAGVGGLVAAEVQRRNAEDEVASARAQSLSAPGLAERTAAQVQVARETANADGARSARRDWALVSAAIWTLSIVDTYYWTPRLADAEVDLTDVTLHLKPLRRGEAVLRSIVPGLGQYYAGRRTAAGLAFFGGLAAGTIFVVSEHRYSDAVNRLAAVEALYADPLADPEALALIRPAVEEEAEKSEDARKLRNLTAALAAGVWGANILDALLATPGSSGGNESTGSSPEARGSTRFTFTPGLAPEVALRVVW
jgi:hypothetical protein